MSRIRRDFIRAMNEEMKRQGLSQRDLARILGCSAENVSQLLDARRSGMRLDSLERLAGALGYRVRLVFTPRAAAGTVAPLPTVDSGGALIDLDRAQDLDLLYPTPTGTDPMHQPPSTDEESRRGS